jgi:hypothetical protein
MILRSRISGNEATDLPCDISLGAGIDHSVAVDGEIVVVLFLALLVRRHSKEQRVKGRYCLTRWISQFIW